MSIVSARKSSDIIERTSIYISHWCISRHGRYSWNCFIVLNLIATIPYTIHEICLVEFSVIREMMGVFFYKNGEFCFERICCIVCICCLYDHIFDSCCVSIKSRECYMYRSSVSHCCRELSYWIWYIYCDRIRESISCNSDLRSRNRIG